MCYSWIIDCVETRYPSHQRFSLVDLLQVLNPSQSTPPTVNTPEEQPSSGQQGNTRERLLSAATSLFSQKGFAGASVRDICTAAEANIASINYYFGSKDALYSEVVQAVCEASDPGHAMPCLADDPSDPEGLLAAWIKWFVRTNLNPRMEQMAQLMLVHLI